MKHNLVIISLKRTGGSAATNMVAEQGRKAHKREDVFA